MGRKIVVCIPFTEGQKQKIEDAAGAAQIKYISREQVNAEDIADAEIIMGNVPIQLLKRAEKLAWLQLNSAGANPYCTAEELSQQVILTNAAGAYGESVSEHMLAGTVAMFKRLQQYQQNQWARKWKDQGTVQSICNTVILVLGCGDIGSAYARKMKALGSYVIGVRRTKGACPQEFDEVHQIEELDQCLSRADLVAITLPGTRETAGMFHEERLRRMKPGAYLINVGRGNIVVTEALEKVMEEEYLAGAFLDVTDPEPLPEGHAGSFRC